jgi:hypothetical protein
MEGRRGTAAQAKAEGGVMVLASRNGNTDTDISVKDEGDFAAVIAYTPAAFDFVDAYMPIISALDSGRVAIEAAQVRRFVEEAKRAELSVSLE